MTSWARRALGLSCLAWTVGAPHPARADDEGFKVGEGRLHVSLALRGRYDTFASADPTGRPVGDFLFDIDPGLKLRVPSRVLAIDLNADVDEVLYKSYSTLDRTLVNAGLLLDFFNQGVVGLQLGDQFTRANNPTVSVLPYAVIGDLNTATVRLPIRPGGGALVFTPGYDFTYQHFEAFNVASGVVPTCPDNSPACTPATATELDYFQHRGSLDVSWHFLPKTAVLLDGEFVNLNYIHNASGADEPLSLFDVTLGLAGLLTSHIDVLAKAGYAQTLVNPPAGSAALFANVSNDQTVVGQLQLGYLFNETSSVRIGYVRALAPEPTGLAYVEDNRPYLQAKALLGRVALHLDVSLDVDSFANNLGGTGRRTDLLLHLDVGPEVEIFRWLQAGVGYNLTSLGSNDNAAFSVYTGSAAVIGGSGYTNHEVYLRLNFVY